MTVQFATMKDNAYLRKNMSAFVGLFQNEVFAEIHTANGKLLQQMDPRVKLLVILTFLVLTGTARHIGTLLVLAAVAAFYAKASGLSIKAFFKRVWLTLPILVALMSLPATTNWLIPGQVLIPVHGDLAVTVEGVESVARMAIRVGTSLSFAYLLVLTTRWHHLTKAMEILKVPTMMIGLLNLTYRYLYVLSRIALEMMEARFLRTIGTLANKNGRKFIANRMAFLFIKSSLISEEIYGAMRCRGYTGEPVALASFKIKSKDKVWLMSNAVVAVILLIGENLWT